MSYDAVGVSSSDLEAGLEFFKNQPQDFPWISANIYTSDNKPLFPPYIIKTINSLTVGIIGLTGQTTHKIKGISVGDWRKVLATHLEQLKKTCDIVIALSSLTDAENRELANRFQDVDFLFSALKNRGNMVPRLIKNTMLTQCAAQGKYLGKLRLQWYPLGTWRTVPAIPSKKVLNQRIHGIDWQIKQLNKRNDKTSADISQKIAALQKKRTHTLQLLSEYEKAKTVERKPEHINKYTSVFLPVRPVKTPSPVSDIVDQVKKNVNDFTKTQHKILRKKRNITGSRENPTNGYAGTAACTQCHQEQYESWSMTGHALAFTTLVENRQSFNSDCLPCHVTSNVYENAPERKKNRLLNLPPQFQAVGCEVCHGPGKKHIRTPNTTIPARRPQLTVCLRCHTPKRDTAFDYQKKLAAISCNRNKQ